MNFLALLGSLTFLRQQNLGVTAWVKGSIVAACTRSMASGRVFAENARAWAGRARAMFLYEGARVLEGDGRESGNTASKPEQEFGGHGVTTFAQGTPVPRRRRQSVFGRGKSRRGGPYAKPLRLTEKGEAVGGIWLSPP